MERLAPDSVVIRLAGEVDCAALACLDVELRRIERQSSNSVLVDAADVTFFDLSVVARLAAAHQRLEGVGGGVLVAYPPECLLRLLDLLEEIDLPVLR